MGWLCADFRPKCSLSVKSTKVGMMIVFSELIKIGYGAITKNQNGRHFEPEVKLTSGRLCAQSVHFLLKAPNSKDRTLLIKVGMYSLRLYIIGLHRSMWTWTFQYFLRLCDQRTAHIAGLFRRSRPQRRAV